QPQPAIAGDGAAIQTSLAPESHAEPIGIGRSHELGAPEAEGRRASGPLETYRRLRDLRAVEHEGGPCRRPVPLRGGGLEREPPAGRGRTQAEARHDEHEVPKAMPAAKEIEEENRRGQAADTER